MKMSITVGATVAHFIPSSIRHSEGKLTASRKSNEVRYFCLSCNSFSTSMTCLMKMTYGSRDHSSAHSCKNGKMKEE